jgi:hypothetical protein
MTADLLQFVTSAPEMYQRARDRLAAASAWCLLVHG